MKPFLGRDTKVNIDFDTQRRSREHTSVKSKDSNSRVKSDVAAQCSFLKFSKCRGYYFYKDQLYTWSADELIARDSFKFVHIQGRDYLVLEADNTQSLKGICNVELVEDTEIKVDVKSTLLLSYLKTAFLVDSKDL